MNELGQELQKKIEAKLAEICQIVTDEFGPSPTVEQWVQTLANMVAALFVVQEEMADMEKSRTLEDLDRLSKLVEKVRAP